MVTGVEETKRSKRQRGSLFMGPWSEISHGHKRRRNEQEQNQTGIEGGRQVNKAGEGGEPQSYQSISSPRQEGGLLIGQKMMFTLS